MIKHVLYYEAPGHRAYMKLEYEDRPVHVLHLVERYCRRKLHIVGSHLVSILLQ